MAQGRRDNPVVVTEHGRRPYQQNVHIGKHHLIADEPTDLGGTDAGPAPFDLLLASLGACTSITLRMYADRKRLPLTGISVALAHDNVEVEGRKVDRVSRTIALQGELTTEQRDSLLTIANKCPMYRTLQSAIVIESALADAGSPAVE
ncbi:OsmC family protein [Accumulibacter sp.]|uniref:OsmC family protein n=1 Tax=Accumulibacter sp. TaxID=2053492 RepID=UPI00261ED321|nr:OsmC family protein [Accumulibacter sp.]